MLLCIIICAMCEYVMQFVCRGEPRNSGKGTEIDAHYFNATSDQKIKIKNERGKKDVHNVAINNKVY